MKRREFVRKGLGAGIAAGSAMAMTPYTRVWGNISLFQNYDLVAVKGGEPGAMFDRAIQSMGGMEAFVKKGQKVVVKPNIGWDAVPERASNTMIKIFSPGAESEEPDRNKSFGAARFKENRLTSFKKSRRLRVLFTGITIFYYTVDERSSN